jgi:hypothetical protein
MLPGFFAATGGSDAVEEWRAFVAARPDDAADALAALDWLGERGPSSIPDEDRDRMGMPDLYCRQRAEWGVFYTVSGAGRGPWAVTVLLVVNFAVTPVNPAAKEAKRRKALL